MEIERKILCRFCFKLLQGTNFQTIGELIRNFLNTLLLKLNLDMSEEPSVCCDCVDDLQKAFEFKSMFIYTKKFLRPNTERGIRYNVDGHFLFQRDETEPSGSSNKEWTCLACAKFVKADCVSSAHEMKEFIAVWKYILERHLPEVDLIAYENTVICMTCFTSIKQCVKIIEKCLDAEDRITKHYLAGNINNRLVDEDIAATSNMVEKIKTEVDPSVLKYIKKEEEEEVIGLETGPRADVKTEMWNFETSLAPQEILWLKNEPQQTDSSSIDNFTSDNCSYQNDNSLQTIHTEHNNKLLNDNVDPAEIKRFQCDMCNYKTKRKAHLKSHLESHRRKSQRQMFKCNLCIFQAQFKSMLRKHMVVHTDPSQLKMFKCQVCAYQTKYKGSLTGHMQKHNAEGYKCKVCGFETKYRKNLDRHMMTHRDPAEIPKYKCALCDFEARRKSHLSMHISVKHRVASDVTKFGCEVCGFEFVSKSDLNRHSKTVHKDPSEITMYSCPQCSFQTKYKDHLPRHMITHKDVSEVVTYKCEFCPFQTKYENGIKGHQLLHSDASEHPVFRCKLCDFVTNRRQYLSRHRTIHKQQMQVVLGN